MEKGKTSFMTILKIGGAICAYLIGSGFASGQELLQYYASYGLWGLGAALIACITLSYMAVSLLRLGKRENITNPHQAFTYYCGEKIGSVFEFVAFAYLIIQVVVFFTGSGATIAQAFGVSPFVGAAIMGVAVILTALLGLNKIADIIGSIGIVLIITVVSMTLYFFGRDPGAVVEGNEIVATMDILQPSKYWFMSGFLYETFNLLGLVAFLPLLGAKSHTQKENTAGGLLGSILLALTISLVTLAFLTDIGTIGTELVPMLCIAKYISPLLASAFSIVILLGVYTGASPMYWNFCSKIIPENDKKFKPFVLILGVIALVLGALLPFDKVINVVYLIFGWAGTGFLVFMLYCTITRKGFGKKAEEIKK